MAKVSLDSSDALKEVARRFESIQKLKFTYRLSGRKIRGEKESTADHTWCCSVVAEYLIVKLDELCPGKYPLDKLRVHQLIMFHDLLEAETGDVDLDPSASAEHLTKSDVEAAALCQASWKKYRRR